MTDTDPIAPKISTAAIEMLALECDAEAREWASMQLEPMFERIAASLRALAAERDAQAAEIERLRGDLKKARDVIDWALICWDDHNKHGYNMQGDWVSDARATLAELTGGKP